MALFLSLKIVLNPHLRRFATQQASVLPWPKMSQLSVLLSEARATADEISQDEQDFIQVQNKSKRFHNQNERNSISEPVRPIVITIKPRPTQVQFARAMKTKLPQLKIQRIRELPNSFDFFIQPENEASRASLVSSINLQPVFTNGAVNARNAMPKPNPNQAFYSQCVSEY